MAQSLCSGAFSARQAIRAGTLLATIEQHPDRMGELGVEAALRLLKNEPVPPEIVVQTDLVTAKDLVTSAPAAKP